MNACYVIYDMSRQGRAMGTLMAIIEEGDRLDGKVIGASVESSDVREVHESAQCVAKENGYESAQYIGYEIRQF